MVNFASDCDSINFCQKIIGETILNENELTISASFKNTKLYSTNSYNFEVKTIIKACMASLYGDLQTLKDMKSRSLDLSLTDYDLRSPLYYAVRGKQTSIVSYLLE